MNDSEEIEHFVERYLCIIFLGMQSGCIFVMLLKITFITKHAMQ